MKKIIFMICMLFGINAMADESNQQVLHHQFTTINGFTKYDEYGTFTTDDGKKIKVSKEWFDIFENKPPVNKKILYFFVPDHKEQNLIFYTNDNTFKSFGRVYKVGKNTSHFIASVGLPDKNGNVLVIAPIVPTAFQLLKDNPDFDKLYTLLKELQKNQKPALIGTVLGRYFTIVDIKVL